MLTRADIAFYFRAAGRIRCPRRTYFGEAFTLADGVLRSYLPLRYRARAEVAAWTTAFREVTGPCEALASRDPVVGSRA